jgi:hypothetical protein
MVSSENFGRTSPWKSEWSVQKISAEPPLGNLRSQEENLTEPPLENRSLGPEIPAEPLLRTRKFQRERLEFQGKAGLSSQQVKRLRCVSNKPCCY